jgi:hypothetical protein
VQPDPGLDVLPMDIANHLAIVADRKRTLPGTFAGQLTTLQFGTRRTSINTIATHDKSPSIHRSVVNPFERPRQRLSNSSECHDISRRRRHSNPGANSIQSCPVAAGEATAAFCLSRECSDTQ